MEWIVENQELAIAAVTGIAGALYAILKIVAKLTKTTVDDEIVEAIEEVKGNLDNDEPCK